MRTASEKVRNRTSFSTGAVQHSPATRVNRFLGRLIEARQTELDLPDLNYITLTYRNRDRENRVRGFYLFFFLHGGRDTMNLSQADRKSVV